MLDQTIGKWFSRRNKTHEIEITVIILFKLVLLEVYIATFSVPTISTAWSICCLQLFSKDAFIRYVKLTEHQLFKTLQKTMGN